MKDLKNVLFKIFKKKCFFNMFVNNNKKIIKYINIKLIDQN